MEADGVFSQTVRCAGPFEGFSRELFLGTCSYYFGRIYEIAVGGGFVGVMILFNFIGWLAIVTKNHLRVIH